MSNVKIQGSPTGTGNVTVVAPVTNSDITITLPSADGTLASAGSIGDGTLTMNTSGVGLSGSQTFTANQTGNATFTIASNATSVNTVSTVVARDASGNFSAGTITAALSGNSTTSTTATNLAGGSAGTVPYQSAAGTTVQLAAGTAGQVLQSNGAAAPSWATIASANNGTLTMNVSGTGLSGSQTFTANQSSNATFTVTSNATNANTASTIVARDASGNFSAGTITASLNGNASTVGGYAVSTSGTANTIPTRNGSGYLSPANWIQLDGSYGLYWPNHYGAHLHANDLSTYTQIALRGSKSSYGGIYDQYSAVNGMMYDSSGNGGVYREANGRWYLYHNVSNACLGVGTSTTGSSYGIYSVKGIYAEGLIRAGTNFYADQNYGYGLVGAYASTIFQGFFAMGDAYKLTAGGGINNLYGVTWSYPSAGGIAGNLDSHGLIVAINGGFGSCLSYNVKASANVTAYSDERLKKNWEPLCDNYVEKLAGVKVGTYERTDLPIVQVGVSAQSLEPVLPEAVSTATDDMQTKSVAYGNAALASAVMLAREIVELKNVIKQMQAELAELKRGV